jgi:WD40 repeat protein
LNPNFYQKMTSFDASRANPPISAFDGLVKYIESIELPPCDTFFMAETELPSLKILLQQYADQHSRTKKEIASLRSAWTRLASVAPHILSPAVPKISSSAVLPPSSSLPDAAPSAVSDVASGCSELENSCQLVRQLQQQLQDLTSQYEAQNEDVCIENERLRLQISELEARLLAAPSNSSASHAMLLKCSDGIVSGKNRRNEQYLRDVFNRHKGAQGGLSGQNLVQALQDVDSPNIPISVQDIADVMNQFDANSNGVLEFGEFQQAVNEPDELQMWLGEKQLPIAADALRSLVGRGSDQLKTFSQLSAADIDHAAAATCAIISSMLKELHQELQAAFAVQSRIEADMKADPSKFNDFYKMACGNITDFHKGLTGRVGMPHLNFKNAMRQEHCERVGCDVQFTTGNYNITTTPRQEWQYIVENVPCPDMRHERRLVLISDLLQLDISKTAKLCEEEVIAIVLYTGPMFQIYNTILRRYPAEKFESFEKGDNQFSTTIFVLVSAVQKLSRFTRIPLGTLLYRGLGGKVDLPDIFFQIDDKGCSGYAEWGFLSTTSDRDVALGYSGVKERRLKAMVMVIETSSIDRGADISEFSQYPGEKEFLYLPCSFIQRTRRGNERAQVVYGGLVAFVSVRVNLNIKTQTVEELQAQKKSLHMVSAKSILPEVKFELTESLEFLKRHNLETSDFLAFTAKAIQRCEEMVKIHDQCDPRDFATDEVFRRMVNEVFDTRATVLSDKLFELHGKISTCIATLNDHSDKVTFVVFHPTLPLMATCSDDQTAKVWHLTSDNFSATCVATAEHKNIVKVLAFVVCVAFHPTLPIFATASADKTSKLWRLSSDYSVATLIATLAEHSSFVWSVAFHQTAPLLATGSRDASAKLWLLSPDCSSVICVATLTGHRGRLFNSVCSVAFHPTAPLLATGSCDNTAKLWCMSSISSSRASVACVATLEGHNGWVSCVAFHPTAPILATSSEDGTIKLWRLSVDKWSATCAATLEGHRSNVWCVVFHPTAPILASSSQDRTVKLWRLSIDISKGECVTTLVGHSKTVRSVAFHPKLPFLATACHDKTVKLWQ